MKSVSLPSQQPPRLRRKTLCACVLALSSFSWSIGIAAAATNAADVDEAKIIANAKTGKEWPSNALDYPGTRFSRLKKIDAANVGKLGLVWSYDLESTRGVEATPVVVNGVMYVTAPWAVVHAIDVRTGKRIWTYDPETPRSVGWKACCDVVNRGVAVYKGKVYVGSLDARLIAIDARTGRKVWEQDTKTDKARKITITSAPYVVRGKVLVGNGGGEYGVRGYVTAYDAETGAQKWRWFVTPGDPSKPFEDESQAMAALTWDPSTKYWENGGGGNVWNTMAIDPALNLVYFGTGQPGPWAKAKRSPTGGDSLFTASIVALNLDTGKYVWHYQENPRDTSDYDSTMDLILADIRIDNRIRKVVLHAPKNGFFYVVDRTNGKFISAKNFVDQNWAYGIDPNGRPIETPNTPTDKPFEAIPGPFGGHNWQSMSFSPLTGLAYLPAHNVPLVLVTDNDWKGQDTGGSVALMRDIGWNLGMLASDQPPKSKLFGRLIAWDPVKQKEAWGVDLGAPWNGGTLVTAGNLVFQGTADARFKAFDARTGKQLWETPVGSGVIAAPMTYEVDGKQYVSIAVGWGGVYGETARHSNFKTRGTVYTFAIGGKAKMPAFTPYNLGPLIAGVKYDPKDVPEGTALYLRNCLFCHGVPGVDKGGNISNLGYVSKSSIDNLDKMIFNGPFGNQGMPDYTGKLTAQDVEKLKAFIQGVPDSIRPK
ncbi:MAG: PQQ-dependent dehydrogenase, methanol/ethanol family [Betaproteobacteria bacterium]|nr:PQQ-dependent dehydrogenase, methanol/ethanol family [Betaproteobacteria bacterium]